MTIILTHSIRKAAPGLRGGLINHCKSTNYNPNNIMQKKFDYVAPECSEFAFSMEGIIATSPGLGDNIGSPFENVPDELFW